MKHQHFFVFVASVAVMFVGFATSGCNGSSDPAPIEIDDTGPDEPDAGEIDADDVQDTDPEPEGPPEKELAPENITFEGVEIDNTASAEVVVDNLGGEDLEIEAVELSIEDDQDHRLELGEDSDELPASVPSGEHLAVFDIEYTPLAAGSTTGEIIVESNDPDEPEQSIRVETISAYPELEAPDRITFDPVDAGESELLKGEDDGNILANRGTQVLDVESVEVEGRDDDAFDVELIGTNGLPDTLDQHAFWYLDVTFEPESNNVHRAEIIVTSNHDDEEEHETVIEVSGNHDQPCLSTTGNLDFGEMYAGQTQTDTITLLNCSTQTVEVEDIEIVDDGGGVFELGDDVDESVVLGNPGENYHITVEATMSTDQEVVGRLTMSWNAPSGSDDEIALQLRARPQ